MVDDIKEFSSSLIFLSLNLLDIDFIGSYQVPFNGIVLQQFLESMIELKQFHLYVKLPRYSNNKENILSSFKNEYWFDHNWSFGIHGRYFYTLPFHFDYLHEFYEDFDNVKSNNPELLIINPRIWYNVKFIDLRDSSTYNFNFLKQLKMKMPKLTSIKFRPFLDDDDYIKITEGSYVDIDEREKSYVTLDNVTTIKCTRKYFQDGKHWLIYALPNLNHLLLSTVDLPSTDIQLAEILNKRIRRLDIDAHSKLDYPLERSEWVAVIVTKILKNFKSLQKLIIHNSLQFGGYIKVLERNLRKLMGHLDMEEIKKKYQMKQFPKCILFSKEGYGNGKIQSGPLSSILRKLSFFNRINIQ